MTACLLRTAVTAFVLLMGGCGAQPDLTADNSKQQGIGESDPVEFEISFAYGRYGRFIDHNENVVCYVSRAGPAISCLPRKVSIRGNE